MNNAASDAINLEIDPFDEPLEERLVLNDTYFAAARDSVTVDGMEFTFLKPPYMNFDDHICTKSSRTSLSRQHAMRRPAVPGGKAYPGAEQILTPPATPESVLIDEGMVTNMLSEYKAHFPKEISTGAAPRQRA